MRTIAVFARVPAAGRVKTRLSPALPADLAVRVYRSLLDDTLFDAGACRADARELWWAGDGAPPAPAGWTAREQRGEALGERLAHAFAALLASPGDRAVVIGSDCPGLGAAALDRAFAALENADVVLGPAADGGYWGIGLARPAPRLFEDIGWGGPRVREQTERRADELGLKLATLEPLADLDTPGDLAGVIGALARGSRACGRALLVTLRELRLVP